MHGRGEIEEKGKRVWEIETKSVLRATSEENNSIISYHIIYHTSYKAQDRILYKKFSYLLS